MDRANRLPARVDACELTAQEDDQTEVVTEDTRGVPKE